jgi:hypothetical protein
MDLQEVGWEGAWTGLIWHRIGTGGGNLFLSWHKKYKELVKCKFSFSVL